MDILYYKTSLGDWGGWKLKTWQWQCKQQQQWQTADKFDQTFDSG